MSNVYLFIENEDPALFADAFRRAAGFFPAGVAILAGFAADHQPFGFTVSRVTCISFAPALVSVCVDRSSSGLPELLRGARFSINLLQENQADLATLFATPGLDRFKDITWHSDSFGVPLIDGAPGLMLCEFAGSFEAGDHWLIIGSLRRLLFQDGRRPLIHWRRAFQKLALDYPFLENEHAMDDFVHRWERGTLPKASWTHAAHVAIAAHYAFHFSQEEAFRMTRAGILHFNTCVGTQNAEDRGYHETLTRFWSGVVGDLVRRHAFSSRLGAVRAAIDCFGEDRDRHRLYYSFDVVRDGRARREWVPPDRFPLFVDASEAAVRGKSKLPTAPGEDQ
jgi:flavin reductase (DIM6/NTAB) family NADH-FMN oxidoreductase RutF